MKLNRFRIQEGHSVGIFVKMNIKKWVWMVLSFKLIYQRIIKCIP